MGVPNLPRGSERRRFGLPPRYECLAPLVAPGCLAVRVFGSLPMDPMDPPRRRRKEANSQGLEFTSQGACVFVFVFSHAKVLDYI